MSKYPSVLRRDHLVYSGLFPFSISSQGWDGGDGAGGGNDDACLEEEEEERILKEMRIMASELEPKHRRQRKTTQVWESAVDLQGAVSVVFPSVIG